MTRVEMLGAVDISMGPTPLDLGVRLTQGAHRRITATVYRDAVAWIPSGFEHGFRDNRGGTLT